MLQPHALAFFFHLVDARHIAHTKGTVLLTKRPGWIPVVVKDHPKSLAQDLPLESLAQVLGQRSLRWVSAGRATPDHPVV